MLVSFFLTYIGSSRPSAGRPAFRPLRQRNGGSVRRCGPRSLDAWNVWSCCWPATKIEHHINHYCRSITFEWCSHIHYCPTIVETPLSFFCECKTVVYPSMILAGNPAGGGRDSAIAETPRTPRHQPTGIQTICSSETGGQASHRSLTGQVILKKNSTGRPLTFNWSARNWRRCSVDVICPDSSRVQTKSFSTLYF